MKNVVKVFLVLFIFSGLRAQTQNEKGLYIDNDGELFNGVIQKTDKNLKTTFTIKNGLIDGEAMCLYSSGQLMEKGNFVKGQKDEKWIRFNENGITIALAFYKNGKKTGTWFVFDDNGTKRFEMNYLEGQKTGIWTNWDEQGLILASKNYSQLN